MQVGISNYFKINGKMKLPLRRLLRRRPVVLHVYDVGEEVPRHHQGEEEEQELPAAALGKPPKHIYLDIFLFHSVGRLGERSAFFSHLKGHSPFLPVGRPLITTLLELIFLYRWPLVGFQIGTQKRQRFLFYSNIWNMDVLGYFHNNFGAPGRALTAKLFFLPGTSSGTLQHWKEQQQQQHIYVPRGAFKGKKHFHLPSLSLLPGFRMARLRGGKTSRIAPMTKI